jgi:hypothetical protein
MAKSHEATIPFPMRIAGRGFGWKEEEMLKENGMEEELRKWREARSQKHAAAVSAPKEKRTVRVNGNEVVIVKKPPKRNLV